MTYSHDLRIKTLDYLEKGGSQAEASRLFGVTTRTVFNWVKRKESGCLAPSKRKERRPHKVDNEKLKAYLKGQPDAYLREIAQSLGASVTAVFYACKRLNIRLKKRHLSIARGMRKKGQSFKKS